MQQTDRKINCPGKDNYNGITKLTSFIHLHDLHHPAMITNTYLAVEKAANAGNGIHANDILIMQDFFGALDY